MASLRPLDPYHRFTRAEWSRFRDGEPMTLTAEDIERLRSLTDPISLFEAEEVYLPLARLMSFYVEATQAVHRVSTRFLGADDRKVPFVIGVAGSVASGKSTTSRILRALLQRWRNSPKVDLVTTDGFLYPNAVLNSDSNEVSAGNVRRVEGIRQTSFGIDAAFENDYRHPRSHLNR